MRKLTPEQEANRQKREQRSTGAIKDGTQTSTPVHPVNFPTAIGLGTVIQIGKTEVEITEFVLSKMPQAGRLLRSCPFCLVAHARANKDTEDFDFGRTASLITSEEEKEVSAKEVAEQLSITGSQLSEIEAEAMLDLVLLNAQRRSPEVTRAALDEGMNIPTFLVAVRLILRHNAWMADVFPSPSPAG